MITPADISLFRKQGYIILHQAITADDLLLIQNRANQYIEKKNNPAVFSRWNKSGQQILIKISQLARQDGLFLQLSMNKHILDAIKHLIGSSELFRDVLVVKPPFVGSSFHFHQDAAYWDVANPDKVISAWIALDDATEESGCLQVVPGSQISIAPHRIYIGNFILPKIITRFLRKAVSLTGTGDNPTNYIQTMFMRLKSFILGKLTRILPALNDLNELQLNPSQIPIDRVISLPIRAGDVILFHSQLFHASGPNQQNYFRRSYIMTYKSTC
ncbi:MAG: phytanoyl-CoA dioxygenase family protein [Gammaproteobacteria bacterium]